MLTCLMEVCQLLVTSVVVPMVGLMVRGVTPLITTIGGYTATFPTVQVCVYGIYGAILLIRDGRIHYT